MTVTGAEPEDTGQSQHTPTCPVTRVSMHTHRHTLALHSHGRKTEAQAVGEGRRSGAQASVYQAPTQAPSGNRQGRATPRAPQDPLSSVSSQGRAQFGGCRDPIVSQGVHTLGNSCPSPEAASSPECFPGGRRAAGGPSWGSQGPGGLRPLPFQEQGGAPTRGRSRREAAPLFTTALGGGRPPLHGPGGQACQMASFSSGRPVLGGQRGKPPRS